MDNRNIERDILKNSYYMVNLFQLDNKTITNLKLQKLMYFVEALYMNKTGDNELYDEDWVAWNYGPVSKRLYNFYKKFGSMQISLTRNEVSEGNSISNTNKEIIKTIYSSFGQLSAFQLVSITHMVGSPWHKIKIENNYDLNNINNSSIISKRETQEWFNEEFGDIFNETK